MSYENMDITGKVLVFDNRFDIGLMGARFLMDAAPEAVVITRDNDPVGILVNENQWAQQGKIDKSDAIRIPASLTEIWMGNYDGSFFMFSDMLMENEKPLSLDLGAATGRTLFLPVNNVSGIDLEHAIVVGDESRMEFKFYLAKPYFKEELGRDFSLEDYKDRSASAHFSL